VDSPFTLTWGGAEEVYNSATPYKLLVTITGGTQMIYEIGVDARGNRHSLINIHGSSEVGKALFSRCSLNRAI
jgi:hypothetical protein